MPPKKKGGKKAGKGGGEDDDAFWAAKEAETAAKLAAVGVTPIDEVDQPPTKKKAGGKKTAFEMLEDFQAGVADEDDEDADAGGGLMVSAAWRVH